jgi:hypothetical protein
MPRRQVQQRKRTREQQRKRTREQKLSQRGSGEHAKKDNVAQVHTVAVCASVSLAPRNWWHARNCAESEREA